jgi:hypothetical protein
MSIKWKKRFKPDVILKKIASLRTIDPDGRVFYTSFEVDHCISALQSMLELPKAADDVDITDLVSRGLTGAGKELTPESFLTAINKEFRNRLATREQVYYLLTTVSLDSRDVPRKLQILGTEIRFLTGNYARRFDSRATLLHKHTILSQTPSNYCKVAIKTKAKSPSGAVSKAFRAFDLQRALWCLMENLRMEITSGLASHSPINVVRLGNQHTLHLSTGEPAIDGIWFEPGFIEAKIYRIRNPDSIKRSSRWALRQIAASRYGEILISALVRFVRALDERDANTAFIRLWGAVEALTQPDKGNNEKTVQRCAFLFKEREYNEQLLEHLREYRNANIHAGEESKRARAHCFQLKYYFSKLIGFHLYNAKYFHSLDEANHFLDSPCDQSALKRQLTLVRKAVHFTS